MVVIDPLEDDSILVEVRVNNKIWVAAELAAIAGSKPVSKFLEDILVEYLKKTGYLSDPVAISPRLSQT